MTKAKSNSNIRLKPDVHWIEHPDGYWLLRNPKDVTYLQVDDFGKNIISQLENKPPAVMIEEYGISSKELRDILQSLAATKMLEGMPPSTPPKGAFNPLKLLFFKYPLCNPDEWLARHVQKIRYIFTRSFGLVLMSALTLSLTIALAQYREIVTTGKEIWARHGNFLIVPFVLLVIFVIFIHELGHAFTLKHYGGIVPEMGLLFICLLPGAYTNTTDAYCLTKRRQRVLVVAAGILCQFIIWAIAWGIWNLSPDGTIWQTGSYLLMGAALLTVVFNLNPLNRFDGYYLAVAFSGINNLRSRSFKYYVDLCKFQKSKEREGDRLFLAIYAPLSLAYTIWMFSRLLLWLWQIVKVKLQTTGLLVAALGVWSLYLFLKKKQKEDKITDDPKQNQAK